MKWLLPLGLRLLGLGLVAFILITQVTYRDRLELDSGQVVTGTARGTTFTVASSGEEIRLGDDGLDESRVSPGLFSILRTSKKVLLLFFVFFYGPLSLVSIIRWWYILRVVGVPVSFWEAFRLTFIGFFFNSAVPGLTGGDLVKGVYIARAAGPNRVKAFMSVLVDRVIGLFGLGLLSAVVLLPFLDDGRYRGAASIVFSFLAGSILFGSVFLSRRLRNLVRIEQLIRRMPLSRILIEVDQAIVLYRQYPRAIGIGILLSLLNHILLVVMAVGIGRSIGMDIPVVQFFILVPVCMMLASIPLLPGGWGLRETAFTGFFGLIGVPATQAFALSVLIGLTQLLWSLLGGVFFLARPDRVTRGDVENLSREVEQESDGEGGPPRPVVTSPAGNRPGTDPAS